jgi:hypothetical protein
MNVKNDFKKLKNLLKKSIEECFHIHFINNYKSINLYIYNKQVNTTIELKSDWFSEKQWSDILELCIRQHEKITGNASILPQQDLLRKLEILHGSKN